MTHKKSDKDILITFFMYYTKLICRFFVFVTTPCSVSL